ncbi:recombination regulator RecX, partial [Streptomyces hirsutus]
GPAGPDAEDAAEAGDSGTDDGGDDDDDDDDVEPGPCAGAEAGRNAPWASAGVAPGSGRS